ncbi:MAG: serine/threonine protein kinase [Planctomycetota bacterium]
MDRILDNYDLKIVRKLAAGGMGVVFEGRQCGSDGFDKQVAIKMILPELIADQEFVEMFVGEARLVADLIHQNIVQVYQFGKASDTYFISMEYVHGVNLEGFIERHKKLGKKIPVDLVVFIIARCCMGLYYAHEKPGPDGKKLGVVHRDISPKNIMIDSQGVPKVTDFGIAKAAHLMRDREGEILMGKIPYMSPEQARFEPTDARSDIFSLGTVMYELLAGENIFDDDDTMKTIENVCKAPIPPVTKYNPDVPAPVLEFLSKAMNRDKDARYQTADEFGYDLQANYLYRSSFGPTYQTLQKYLKDLFPQFRTESDHYASVSDTLMLKAGR